MIKAIPMEDWLRGCIYHDGRHGYVTLPIDKVHQIANYIQRTRRSVTDGLIDLDVVRKDENSSEFPNNCEHITEDGVTCAKYPACDDCLDNPLNKVKGSKRLVKGKDEPRTETEIAKAIVHKMIDDAVIAEDAYPNLRQKMHDAVDEYEPQTDCAWMKGE